MNTVSADIHNPDKFAEFLGQFGTYLNRQKARDQSVACPPHLSVKSVAYVAKQRADTIESLKVALDKSGTREKQTREKIETTDDTFRHRRLCKILADIETDTQSHYQALETAAFDWLALAVKSERHELYRRALTPSATVIARTLTGITDMRQVLDRKDKAFYPAVMAYQKLNKLLEIFAEDMPKEVILKAHESIWLQKKAARQQNNSALANDWHEILKKFEAHADESQSLTQALRRQKLAFEQEEPELSEDKPSDGASYAKETSRPSQRAFPGNKAAHHKLASLPPPTGQAASAPTSASLNAAPLLPDRSLPTKQEVEQRIASMLPKPDRYAELALLAYRVRNHPELANLFRPHHGRILSILVHRKNPDYTHFALYAAAAGHSALKGMGIDVQNAAFALRYQEAARDALRKAVKGSTKLERYFAIGANIPVPQTELTLTAEALAASKSSVHKLPDRATLEKRIQTVFEQSPIDYAKLAVMAHQIKGNAELTALFIPYHTRILRGLLSETGARKHIHFALYAAVAGSTVLASLKPDVEGIAAGLALANKITALQALKEGVTGSVRLERQFAKGVARIAHSRKAAASHSAVILPQKSEAACAARPETVQDSTPVNLEPVHDQGIDIRPRNRQMDIINRWLKYRKADPAKSMQSTMIGTLEEGPLPPSNILDAIVSKFFQRAASHPENYRDLPRLIEAVGAERVAGKLTPGTLQYIAQAAGKGDWEDQLGLIIDSANLTRSHELGLIKGLVLGRNEKSAEETRLNPPSQRRPLKREPASAIVIANAAFAYASPIGNLQPV